MDLNEWRKRNLNKPPGTADAVPSVIPAAQPVRTQAVDTLPDAPFNTKATRAIGRGVGKAMDYMETNPLRQKVKSHYGITDKPKTIPHIPSTPSGDRPGYSPEGLPVPSINAADKFTPTVNKPAFEYPEYTGFTNPTQPTNYRAVDKPTWMMSIIDKITNRIKNEPTASAPALPAPTGTGTATEAGQGSPDTGRQAPAVPPFYQSMLNPKAPKDAWEVEVLKGSPTKETERKLWAFPEGGEAVDVTPLDWHPGFQDTRQKAIPEMAEQEQKGEQKIAETALETKGRLDVANIQKMSASERNAVLKEIARINKSKAIPEDYDPMSDPKMIKAFQGDLGLMDEFLQEYHPDKWAERQGVDPKAHKTRKELRKYLIQQGTKDEEIEEQLKRKFGY